MRPRSQGTREPAFEYRLQYELVRLASEVQGLLALGDVPAGYQGIRIEMDIKAKNASDAELDDLLQFAAGAHSQRPRRRRRRRECGLELAP